MGEGDDLLIFEVIYQSSWSDETNYLNHICAGLLGRSQQSNPSDLLCYLYFPEWNMLECIWLKIDSFLNENRVLWLQSTRSYIRRKRLFIYVLASISLVQNWFYCDLPSVYLTRDLQTQSHLTRFNQLLLRGLPPVVIAFGEELSTGTH